MNLWRWLHSIAPLPWIKWLAVKIRPQCDLLHSYRGKLDFKPSLNIAHMSLLNFPPAWMVDVPGRREATACERNRGGISFIMSARHSHSHLLALICVCGHAFCERLNPPLSNDAFMSSVSSSSHPLPPLSLPPSFSHLIKRMGQYASDIKRHQSPRCLPSMLSLLGDARSPF